MASFWVQSARTFHITPTGIARTIEYISFVIQDRSRATDHTQNVRYNINGYL